MKTIKAVVLADFTDAGTGEAFKKGDAPSLDRGAFDNYAAAHLVAEHEVKKADIKASDKSEA